MSRPVIDTEYLSDVWTRINMVISKQEVRKYKLAKKCGFDRKILSSYTNISILYFARLCEELNVSADFLLFGVEKTKERTNAATYSPDKCYKDLPAQQEIVRTANELMKYGGGITVNNLLGISKQRNLMILADDFGLLHREDVQEIIGTCNSFEEGQQEIMKVYEAVY